MLYLQTAKTPRSAAPLTTLYKRSPNIIHCKNATVSMTASLLLFFLFTEYMDMLRSRSAVVYSQDRSDDLACIMPIAVIQLTYQMARFVHQIPASWYLSFYTARSSRLAYFVQWTPSPSLMATSSRGYPQSHLVRRLLYLHGMVNGSAHDAECDAIRKAVASCWIGSLVEESSEYRIAFVHAVSS